MQKFLPIRSALVSVFDKSGLEPLALELAKQNVSFYSTGGTQDFLEGLGMNVHRVEDLTGYPSILGGRVKTLHPKVFGGILGRRQLTSDEQEMEQYQIPPIDLVIVDLYPFEKTVASGADHEAIIEKIDIGGISLIRAGAKNYQDVVILSSQHQYERLLNHLKEQNGCTNLHQRETFAREAFARTSQYDKEINRYFSRELGSDTYSMEIGPKHQLRYGENPHQKGYFYGDLNGMFEQLNGKELSYNNLLDIDAAVQLMKEFSGHEPTFAILKHNNPCGLATRKTVAEAFDAALQADPVSAFGGILMSNREIEVAAAEKINGLFCEVVIATGYTPEALEILRSKKNRIILTFKGMEMPEIQVRTALNGILVQEKDQASMAHYSLETMTTLQPSEAEMSDLLFANKIVKHVKSNTIVLAKNHQLLACGTGQTSRVDALNQAIHKAQTFGFDLSGAVMASDAFFPFPDCVEIAHKAGITAVIQPGGSIKDDLSIQYCNEHHLSMIFTGVRHFKH
jgi:phosphoribosylaminoimidazolecarboxamide formyltransferase/IMP cyclohydrolase